MEKYQITDFKRDFELGDTGDDVAKIHQILNTLGGLFGIKKKIDQKEIDEKRFGPSTMEVAEEWREAYAKKPLLSILADIVLQFVFRIDKEELNPDLTRGKSHAIRNYRDADDKEIALLEASVWGKQGTTGRTVNMANKFIGIRESGNNGGAADTFTGQKNTSWCGGFVNYVMDRTVGAGVYDQKDFLSAQSFMREGKEHGVFHKPAEAYSVRPGDVVVFTRGGGGQGHVGIVTGVAADGTLTYVSGNDGNAVRERTYDMKHPPKSLLGYTDTQALAKAKGIEVVRDEAPTLTARANNLKIAKHSDAAVLRG